MHKIPTHFIDFEASGIAPDSYPIEVGVAYPCGEYQSLIKPDRLWEHWCYNAQDMHGISRDQLIADGSSAVDVATEMNRLFAGQALCSDSPTDAFWLGELFEAAGIEPTFTMRPIEAFVGKEHATAIYRLQAGAKAHRALPDANALADAVARYASAKRTEWDIAAKVYKLHVDSGAPVRDLLTKKRLYDLVCGAVEHLGISIEEAANRSEDELMSLLTTEYGSHPDNDQLRLFLALKLELEVGL